MNDEGICFSQMAKKLMTLKISVPRLWATALVTSCSSTTPPKAQNSLWVMWDDVRTWRPSCGETWTFTPFVLFLFLLPGWWRTPRCLAATFNRGWGQNLISIVLVTAIVSSVLFMNKCYFFAPPLFFFSLQVYDRVIMLGQMLYSLKVKQLILNSDVSLFGISRLN